MEPELAGMIGVEPAVVRLPLVLVVATVNGKGPQLDVWTQPRQERVLGEFTFDIGDITTVTTRMLYDSE